MAAIFQRRRTWWIRFYHPRTKELHRTSLGTADRARALLLCEMLEHHIALLDCRFVQLPVPASVRGLIETNSNQITTEAVKILATNHTPSFPPGLTSSSAEPRTSIDDAVRFYLEFCQQQNVERQVANKISVFRAFLGMERMQGIAPYKKNPRSTKTDSGAPPSPFIGTYVDEITALAVQKFLDALPLAPKTKRHYREVFHHFIDVCLRFEMLRATNVYSPNPIAAIVSYARRNRVIRFLRDTDIANQLDVLRLAPELHLAVAIMIYAGLRRSETLWLTLDAIAPDLSFLSVVNREDAEEDIENCLKTGARSVTILPPVREILERRLPQTRGPWLIPNNKGRRWNGDTLRERVRAINLQHRLEWNCLTYRHTFATQRAAEGWPLFRIAREMETASP